MTEPEAQKDSSVSILDIILIVSKRKGLIFLATVAAMAGAMAFSVLSLALPPKMSYLPNKYTAEALILLKAPTSSGGGASSLSQLSGLGSLVGLSLNSEESQSSSLILSILKQNTFKDQLAGSIGLDQLGGESDPAERVLSNRETIDQCLKAKYEADTGIMAVKYTDIDREFAAKAVNAAVEILQNRFNEIILGYTREKLVIIEDSIDKAREGMREAQRKFTNYQRKYGMYDLNASTASTITLLETTKSNLLKLQNDYRNLSAYRDKDDPQLLRLSQQISQQSEYLRSLQEGDPQFTGQNMSINQMPDVVVEYLLLKEELLTQQGIYTSLRGQYESKQIEEISGNKIFCALERAEVPLRKSGPSRGLICIVATLAGFFLSVLAAFILEYLSNAKTDPREGLKLRQAAEFLRIFRKKA